MSEQVRLSVEAAEAMAEVLLADAMQDRKARLATIATIRRWLTPRWFGPAWYGPLWVRPYLLGLHGRTGILSDDLHVPTATLSGRPANSGGHSQRYGSFVQQPDYGCPSNHWNHQHDSPLCSPAGDHDHSAVADSSCGSFAEPDFSTVSNPCDWNGDG
jgi:hypothetical protein